MNYEISLNVTNINNVYRRVFSFSITYVRVSARGLFFSLHRNYTFFSNLYWHKFLKLGFTKWYKGIQGGYKGEYKRLTKTTSFFEWTFEYFEHWNNPNIWLLKKKFFFFINDKKTCIKLHYLKINTHDNFIW